MSSGPGEVWEEVDAFVAIPIIVEMSLCIELDCFLSRSISDNTVSMRLVTDAQPEHAADEDAGGGAEVGIGTDGVGAADVDCRLEPVGGGGGDSDEGGGNPVAWVGPTEAGGGGDDEVEEEGSDIGGSGFWRLGKYWDMFLVFIPSSRSRNLSERRKIVSSFFFMFESKLVILVWARFSCIFRYSFRAPSSVTAGAFLALFGGGAVGAALGGGGTVAPRGRVTAALRGGARAVLGRRG